MATQPLESKAPKAIQQIRNELLERSELNKCDKFIWEAEGYHLIALTHTTRQRDVRTAEQIAPRFRTVNHVKLDFWFADYSYSFNRPGKDKISNNFGLNNMKLADEEIQALHDFLENGDTSKNFTNNGFEFSFRKKLTGAKMLYLRYIGDREKDAKQKNFTRATRKNHFKYEKMRKRVEQVYFDSISTEIFRQYLAGICAVARMEERDENEANLNAGLSDKNK